MKPVYLAFAFVALATPLLLSPSQAQPVAPIQNAKIRTVFIIGEVQRPGAYQLPLDGTLASLLTLAGGATDDAALTQIVVKRRDGSLLETDLLDTFRTPKAKTAFALQDGDIIEVPRNQNRVLVMGAVKKPGYYAIPEGRTLSVAEALERAGGTISGGDFTDVRVTHAQKKPETGPSILPLPSEAAKPDQLLQNGDVVYVPQKNSINPPNPPRGVARFQFLKSTSSSR